MDEVEATCIHCSEIRFTMFMYQLEDSFICEGCVESHNGLGAYEKYHVIHPVKEDLEPLATVLILEAWDLDGNADDLMSTEGWGYCGLHGKYLFINDDRGFRSFEEYIDETSAQREFDRLYRDGWGAQDDDAYIESGSRGYSVSFSGKTLDVWGRGSLGHPVRLNEGVDMRRCIARVRLESMKTGYYPNLWHVSDHGNLSLIQY